MVMFSPGKHLITRLRSVALFVQSQSLRTTPVIMEEAVEKLKENPYYDKYAKKLEQVQGSCPEEFVQRFQQQQERSKQQPGGHSFSQVATSGKSTLPQGAYAHAPAKSLDRIMKMELLKDKPADEIKYIWNEHFKSKECISGVMDAQLYEKIHHNGMQYPTFVLPLIRDQGYEFILVQFANQEAHFTPLVNYQAYQENAPECLTMVHYTDLQEKNIVLMHGEFDKNIINAHEAQFLANQLQMYYGGSSEEKLQLVRDFHNKPSEFKHAELIQQIENIEIDVVRQGAKD
ncbi:ATP synthase mitochondrial F1 complex assembly factor 1 [Oratosquilla oratoria]|uniref:ATP synthase mitochondrial F1 complex assembly factor 1 n=1 Tax=Oratosquilla oratoria TaxID=337810 RepID=UPI003F75B5D1